MALAMFIFFFTVQIYASGCCDPWSFLNFFQKYGDFGPGVIFRRLYVLRKQDEESSTHNLWISGSHLSGKCFQYLVEWILFTFPQKASKMSILSQSETWLSNLWTISNMNNCFLEWLANKIQICLFYLWW